jgi:hypothetical protein
LQLAGATELNQAGAVAPLQAIAVLLTPLQSAIVGGFLTASNARFLSGSQTSGSTGAVAKTALRTLSQNQELSGAGGLVATQQRGASGQQYSAVRGVITPLNSRLLNGDLEQSASGFLTPSNAYLIQLAGLQYATQSGILGKSINTSASGQDYTVLSGVAGAQIAGSLGGLSGAIDVGQVYAQSGAAINGAAGNFSSGLLQPLNSVFVAINGIDEHGFTGGFYSSLSSALSGQSLFAINGVLIATTSKTAQLVGQSLGLGAGLFFTTAQSTVKTQRQELQGGGLVAGSNKTIVGCENDAISGAVGVDIRALIAGILENQTTGTVTQVGGTLWVLGSPYGHKTTYTTRPQNLAQCRTPATKNQARSEGHECRPVNLQKTSRNTA